MIEGDPTYSIELRSTTSDPAVLEELELRNTAKFTRGETAMKLLWRFLDQSIPPRVHFGRALHEASPPSR